MAGRKGVYDKIEMDTIEHKLRKEEERRGWAEHVRLFQVYSSSDLSLIT